MFVSSVRGEFSLERRTDWRLGRYTLGLSSRGISLRFRRDRLPTFSNSIIRVGVGLGFPRGAFGAAVSIHRGTTNDRSLDLGLRLIPLPLVDLGVVLKNIGRLVLRGWNGGWSMLVAGLWCGWVCFSPPALAASPDTCTRRDRPTRLARWWRRVRAL